MEPFTEPSAERSFHFRRSAFSLQEVQDWVDSPPDSTLAGSLEKLREGVATLPAHEVALGREWSQILEWSKFPQFQTLPNSKALKSARKRLNECAPELRSYFENLLNRVTEVVVLIRELHPQSPTAERESLLVFFSRLENSRFPQLLAWSQPELIRHFFLAERGGRERHRTHALRQAAHTCLGYLFGALGRLAPRDAWVEVGFGRFTDIQASAGSRVALRIDPDLAWFKRRFIANSETPGPGMGAWEYIFKHLIPSISPENDLALLTARLQKIEEHCRELAVSGTLPSLREVLSFQDLTREYLAPWIAPDTWVQDPHHWWITLSEEQPISLPLGSSRFLEEIRERQLNRWRTLGLITEDPSREVGEGKARLPAILRVSQESSSTVLASAEELWDWVLDEQALIGEPFWFPAAVPGDFGMIYSGVGASANFRAVDPTPSRAAERFALHRDPVPSFFLAASESEWKRLMPPRDLVDNRILRLEGGREFQPEEVTSGSEVLWPSSLMSAELAGLLELEFASPRYAIAPEIVPRTLPMEEAYPLTLGSLFKREKVWFLNSASRSSLQPQIQNARTLWLLYQLEVANSLSRPEWLELMIDGKNVLLPTASLHAWSWLYSELSGGQGPVLIRTHETQSQDKKDSGLESWSEGRPWMFTVRRGKAC